jgi:putative lipase involved disintegration of autophagic bodies
MTKVPIKPHYYEDKTLDALMFEMEEIISSSREMARAMDSEKAMVKNSIAIRKELVKVIHLAYNLRKEIVRRRQLWRKRKAEGGRA